MAEGEHFGVAEQQIERAGKHRKAQQLRHEHRINAEIGRRQRRDSEQHMHRYAASHAYSLPNNPAGRQIKTTAMITKTTMFEASG
jgi:hypothetical protein